MTNFLLVIIVIVLLVIAANTDSSHHPSAPAVTTRFALSFCNGYGDIVGDFIFTCNLKETKL